MASNQLPINLDDLLTLAEDMADGLTIYEAAVGVKQNGQFDMRNAISSAGTSQADYNTRRAAKTTLGTAQTVADSNAKAFLTAARLVLIPKLGSEWNDAWLP